MINLEFTGNAVEWAATILAYAAIVIAAIVLYKKQDEKPKVLKIILIMFIGLFSFSINWQSDGLPIRLPILPLGVWILYFFSRGKEGRWAKYRRFAWLGFAANFALLAASLAAAMFYHGVYDTKDPAVYLASVEDAEVVLLHPSAEQTVLRQGALLETGIWTRGNFDSEEWYREITMDDNHDERFPYLLSGTEPKWGSGLESVIYIEKDGKGVLISGPDAQMYYRSEKPLIEPYAR
ncbi:hypothetical protein [Bacillus sp. UMB0728]|uniref:hypothetical protein n=1 Tax=Bacillus sp. UMB0728 TaxID=2066052 RepID=UPI000C7760D9|nr:hypothetical protein [Bacillus sp. UMB0728]PLR71245.1 hypothetical protein CYJ37_20990 [Bacillus sp. UMB0728]